MAVERYHERPQLRAGTRQLGRAGQAGGILVLSENFLHRAGPREAQQVNRSLADTTAMLGDRRAACGQRRWLFTANVHDANPDMGPIAEEIAAMAPGLVALQELDPDDAVRLARSGALDRFPLVDAQVQDVLGRSFISAPAMVGAKETRMGGELAAGATAAPRP